MAVAHPTPRHALRSLRIVWAFMLLGSLAFAGVVAFLLLADVYEPPGPPPAGEAVSVNLVMSAVCTALLIVGLAVAMFMRNQIYKRHWREHAVAPQGYIGGNIVVFALLDAVCMFALIVVLITGSPLPAGALFVIAAGLLLANYPDGRPMQPHPPTFIGRSDLP